MVVKLARFDLAMAWIDFSLLKTYISTPRTLGFVKNWRFYQDLEARLGVGPGSPKIEKLSFLTYCDVQDVEIYVFGYEKSIPAIFRTIQPSFDIIFLLLWIIWVLENAKQKMNENDLKLARMCMKMAGIVFSCPNYCIWGFRKTDICWCKKSTK